MVVCLILKVDKPLFLFAIYIYRYNNTAGIDLIGFFLISQFSFGFVVTFIELHVCKFCGECGMTAVIRPVSIQYTDLCHGRITFFFILKVILNVLEILEGHRKIQ